MDLINLRASLATGTALRLNPKQRAPRTATLDRNLPV